VIALFGHERSDVQSVGLDPAPARPEEIASPVLTASAMKSLAFVYLRAYTRGTTGLCRSSYRSRIGS